MKALTRITICILFPLLLSGCGSGGSDQTPETTQDSWDQMTWDNDNWS